MTSLWEQFEELIKAQMRKIYSEAVVDHSMNPRNLGVIEDADGFGMITGPCGDTMQIWLRVNNGSVTNAAFLTDGSGPSLASGSMVTEMVKGKSISDVLKIRQQDVLDALDGLPQESQHCALLAANTLREAIKNYLAMKREPWRKAYRKH